MLGRGNCGPGGGSRGRFMMAAGRHFPWLGVGRAMLADIDLSDEQMEQISELKQTSFAKMAHGRVDKMDLMQALFRELGKPEIDKNKIAELKEKIKAHKASMSEMMVDSMLSFAEILSAEQRKKIRMRRIRQFFSSERDFEHEGAHEGACSHGHGHGRRHDQAHEPGHGHSHGHGHEHGCSHEHEHEHGHEHEHCCSHEHEHGHGHEHGCSHEHEHGHGHEHGGQEPPPPPRRRGPNR